MPFLCIWRIEMVQTLTQIVLEELAGRGYNMPRQKEVLEQTIAELQGVCAHMGSLMYHQKVPDLTKPAEVRTR